MSIEIFWVVNVFQLEKIAENEGIKNWCTCQRTLTNAPSNVDEQNRHHESGGGIKSGLFPALADGGRTGRAKTFAIRESVNLFAVIGRTQGQARDTYSERGMTQLGNSHYKTIAGSAAKAH